MFGLRRRDARRNENRSDGDALSKDHHGGRMVHSHHFRGQRNAPSEFVLYRAIESQFAVAFAAGLVAAAISCTRSPSKLPADASVSIALDTASRATGPGRRRRGNSRRSNALARTVAVPPPASSANDMTAPSPSGSNA